MSTTPLPPDPTRVRRAQMARLAEVGRCVGYGLFGVAIAVFVAGAVSGFRSAEIIAVVTCLAVGSAVLAPAIVIGYGVRAAEREDRELAAKRGRGA